MSESEACAPQTLDPSQPHRQRLRFASFQFNRSLGGRCSAEVEFEWVDGARARGAAQGQSSPTVDLRVAAEAALRGIEQFTAGALAFELIGVKAIRAFDATVVIVSLANRTPEGPKRLIGAALEESDSPRGAVVAVLSATNRVLGNFIATR